MTFFGFAEKCHVLWVLVLVFFKNQNKHQVEIIFLAKAEKCHVLWVLVLVFFKNQNKHQVEIIFLAKAENIISNQC